MSHIHIKDYWVHYPKLCATGLSSRVDINDNQP
jgi:hypothetical protein